MPGLRCLASTISRGPSQPSLAAQPVVDPAVATEAAEHAAALPARGAELITEASAAHDQMQPVLTSPGRVQPRGFLQDPPVTGGQNRVGRQYSAGTPGQPDCDSSNRDRQSPAQTGSGASVAGAEATASS